MVGIREDGQRSKGKRTKGRERSVEIPIQWWWKPGTLPVTCMGWEFGRITALADSISPHSHLSLETFCACYIFEWESLALAFRVQLAFLMHSEPLCFKSNILVRFLCHYGWDLCHYGWDFSKKPVWFRSTSAAVMGSHRLLELLKKSHRQQNKGQLQTGDVLS